MRGRPPKPTAQKLLEGNPGRRKINEHEPKFEPLGTPPAEVRDDPVALAEWERLAPAMAKNKLLTEADMAMFAVYCTSMGEYRRVNKRILEMGEAIDSPMGMKKNPLCTVRQEAWARANWCMVQMGLTPAARSRVKSVADKPADDGSVGGMGAPPMAAGVVGRIAAGGKRA